MPVCAKCENDVKKVYDCDHTDFEESFLEMKYAKIGNINAGRPNPIPRILWSNGIKPSLLPVISTTATSAAYTTNNAIAIPVIINAGTNAMNEFFVFQ